MREYHMIDRNSKQNIPFQAVPFCVEKLAVPAPDRPHIHDYVQLTIVTGGRAVLTVNNQEAPIRAGDVYFIGSHLAHSLRAPQDLEVVNLLFYLADLLKHAGSLRAHPGFQQLFVLQSPVAAGEGHICRMHLGYEEMMRATQVIDELLREVRGRAPGVETMVQGYFLVLLTCLSRAFEQSDVYRPADGNELYRAVLYMEQHFTEAIPLEKLAQMSHLSERQFRRLFTQRYGTSPTHHLQRLRLNKACHLLRNTALNINEIAQSAGFEDANYFTRLFKAELGAPPKAYRADCLRAEAEVDNP